jgi:hypothetical protein
VSSDTEVDEFLVMMEQTIGCVGGDALPEFTESSSKYIMTDLRKRLSNENLKKLLFIHENLPLIGFE